MTLKVKLTVEVPLLDLSYYDTDDPREAGIIELDGIVVAHEGGIDHLNWGVDEFYVESQ